MHLTRSEASKKLPIRRKGTKYIARALSHVKNSVPVVIAIRDMLGMAKTSKEVKYMIHNKLIKINGREAKDINEPINLFNIIEADKKYKLIVLPTERFSFEETKENHRFCKVVGKKILKGKKIQLNLHDGTNIIADKKININDTVEIDFENKIKEILHAEKGKKIFVISGKSIGLKGKIESTDGKKATIKLENKDKGVELDMSHIMII